MLSIKDMSELSGVSKRTLQYYDRIGLLAPEGYTSAGYRQYDDAALKRLQQILLYRELEFPLSEIKRILNSGDFDRNRALEQQIELLTLKKEHLENLILFARGLHGVGVNTMDFSAFDTRKIDEYTKQAKEMWGKTPEYREFEEKQKQRSEQDDQALAAEFMQIFAEFGQMRESSPDQADVQAQVQKLRDYITAHFYNCSVSILACLGKMYAGGGSMTENIDAVGGEGTAVFTAEAIEYYASARAAKKV